MNLIDYELDIDLSDSDAVRRAEESLAQARTFTSSKYSVDRTDAEAFVWLLDSIASSLYAIAKRNVTNSDYPTAPAVNLYQ